MCSMSKPHASNRWKVKLSSTLNKFLFFSHPLVRSRPCLPTAGSSKRAKQDINATTEQESPTLLRTENLSKEWKLKTHLYQTEGGMTDTSQTNKVALHTVYPFCNILNCHFIFIHGIFTSLQKGIKQPTGCGLAGTGRVLRTGRGASNIVNNVLEAKSI